MVLLESKNIELASEAPDFSLEGTDGHVYSLKDFAGAPALVIVFMCNHCPYVQAIWDRLVALQRRFPEANFVGINPNTANPAYEEETMEKMREYYDRYAMNFPYLEDKDQSVAMRYGAECTPDIFVYDSESKLAYHGRVDDNWKEERAVEKQELAEALEALIAGETPKKEQNPCMGCSIKWLA